MTTGKPLLTSSLSIPFARWMVLPVYATSHLALIVCELVTETLCAKPPDVILCVIIGDETVFDFSESSKLTAIVFYEGLN
ncbi:hypothetical protein L226DRAFT_567828 [Lentinus tigrinus ALCF2SS1-7]|uniref:uncharacterized protein n=1 Tax=Lentinus tigrinus ALCF2SS1-7 TaxID=1328758 RepID=UPI00116605C2|nr:hypothetical protein L226DRAFT_567828 [Lentinus tigrinus ALCF2SS1-7]